MGMGAAGPRAHRAAGTQGWAPGRLGHPWLWDLGGASISFFPGEVGYELRRGLLKWGCWAVERSGWPFPVLLLPVLAIVQLEEQCGGKDQGTALAALPPV